MAKRHGRDCVFKPSWRVVGMRGDKSEIEIYAMKEQVAMALFCQISEDCLILRPAFEICEY